MGIALATHPEGITSQYLERYIANAATSQHPVEQLKAILRRLDENPTETTDESLIANQWAAIALAVGEALAALDLGEQREYHVLSGVAIGISKAFEAKYRGKTLLDVMISEGVAGHDIDKLQEVRRYSNAGYRLSDPTNFLSDEGFSDYSNTFGQMTTRILACGSSKPVRDDEPVHPRRHRHDV